MKKRTLCLLVSALLSLGVFAMAQEEQKDPQEPKEQRETVKRYVDTLPLILANDDYCGIGLNDRTVVGKVFAAEDSDIARSIFSIHEVLPRTTSDHLNLKEFTRKGDFFLFYGIP